MSEIDYLTVTADEIRNALAKGEISLPDALAHTQRALYVQQGRGQDFVSFNEFDSHLYKKILIQINALETLLLELENPESGGFFLCPVFAPLAPDSTPLIPSVRGRLRWLGSNSSWERVYEALTDAGLIDPSPSAWAGHFTTETGGLMKPPKGGTAILGEAKDPKVRAAVALIRKQE